MKRIVLLLSLFLFGCTARPEYYSHSQKITLEGITPHTDLFYQDEKMVAESEKEGFIPNDEINEEQKEYQIFRSWNDQELIIKKTGFNDYHLKLDSVMTGEPWATAEYVDDGERHYFPLLGLLAPVKTVKAVVSVPYHFLMSVLSLITISPIGFTEHIVQTGESLVEIPIALASDVYDIVGVPGTMIINPWTEYQYDSVIVLEPTEALKRECRMSQNSFISNNGCTACADPRVILYASQEECDRCSNRLWDNNRCSLKK